MNKTDIERLSEATSAIIGGGRGRTRRRDGTDQEDPDVDDYNSDADWIIHLSHPEMTMKAQEELTTLLGTTSVVQNFKDIVKNEKGLLFVFSKLIDDYKNVFRDVNEDNERLNYWYKALQESIDKMVSYIRGGSFLVKITPDENNILIQFDKIQLYFISKKSKYFFHADRSRGLQGYTEESRFKLALKEIQETAEVYIESRHEPLDNLYKLDWADGMDPDWKPGMPCKAQEMSYENFMKHVMHYMTLIMSTRAAGNDRGVDQGFVPGDVAEISIRYNGAAKNARREASMGGWDNVLQDRIEGGMSVNVTLINDDNSWTHYTNSQYLNPSQFLPTIKELDHKFGLYSRIPQPVQCYYAEVISVGGKLNDVGEYLFNKYDLINAYGTEKHKSSDVWKKDGDVTRFADWWKEEGE